MKSDITRRNFMLKATALGLAGFLSEPVWGAISGDDIIDRQSAEIPLVKKGDKQIFVDDVMIHKSKGVKRIIHDARKMTHPVLEADRYWETGDNHVPYAAIYGTVLRNETDGTFRMWYNCYKKCLYATSNDGVVWQKPELGQVGNTNMINLFDFHSPSIILDKKENDPLKRYKAVGSKDGFSETVISELKKKFKFSEDYHRNYAYCAAYSADGLNWNRYPEPILLGMDTITLAQDPLNGNFLAFHKQTQDRRSFGRQIFLSVSSDMYSWSDRELVMETDETDHVQARKLEGGTHSEFYNMSAFYYASQWLGLVTLFRCMGEPLVNGKARAGQKGIIDVQLVHSRDGLIWKRCSDRSSVISIGPNLYDGGMVFGVCNTPVIVGDEMWIYYSASADIHGGTNPDKRISIARAVWRLDGMVSLNACDSEGVIETMPFRQGGSQLYVNADVSAGQLFIEVLDVSGKVVIGFEKQSCICLRSPEVHQQVKWKFSKSLPENEIIRLRFYLTKGDLYSYTIA